MALSRMLKECSNCHQKLPETSFSRNSAGALLSRCRQCRSKLEAKRKKRKKDSRLDAIETDAVDLFCKTARMGGTNIPHSAELIEILMEYFGGVRGFGNVFMKQYYDSPPGGSHRTKMLAAMVSLVSHNSAMGGAKKPLALWSEDELEDELRQRLLETAMTLTPHTLVLEHEKTPEESPDST